jgi:hypothetical protein
MVDLKEALSYPSSQVQRLLGMVETWPSVPAEDSTPAEACFQPRQKPGLAEYLGEDRVQALIASFHAGTTRECLAHQIGYSVSSVGRMLRERGVRRW